MDQNLTSPIAEAIKALAAAKARSEEIGRGLTKITDAMAKCRAMVTEHAAQEQKVATLRADRRAMLVESVLAKGDAAALARNDRDIKAAEAKLQELAAQAEDGKVALAELEARHAQAQGPLIALSKEIPRLQAQIFEQAASGVLALYEQRLIAAFDLYLELIALVQKRNTYARLAGLQPALPEEPGLLEYPPLPFARWTAGGTMGARDADMAEARKRLAVKLADMGVADV